MEGHKGIAEHNCWAQNLLGNFQPALIEQFVEVTTSDDFVSLCRHRWPQSCLQLRCESLRRLLRGDDGMNLKFDQVGPVTRPLLQKRWIGSLHDLIAGRQLLID